MPTRTAEIILPIIIPVQEPRCMMYMETDNGSLENISGYVVYDMYCNA